MGYLASSVDQPLDKAIANAAAAGRMYSVSTANFGVSTGGLYAAISLFWTARNSKIVVLSAKANNSASTLVHRLHRTISDPALSGFSIAGLAIRSMLVGQPASTATLTSATEAVSNGTGTLHRSLYVSANAGDAGGELITRPEDRIIIPPGIAGGALLLINGASTNGVSGEIVWAEI